MKKHSPWFANRDWSDAALLLIDENQFEVMRGAAVEVDKANREMYNGIVNNRAALVTLVREYYGVGGVAWKQAQALKIPQFYSWAKFVDELVARRAGAVERKRKADEEKAKATAEAERVARAVLFLAARGKTPGRDYDAARAINAANQVAFHEEVAKQVVEEFTEFDGNCNEYNREPPCRGWDGHSDRCDCGNRRVSWSPAFGHSFEHPHVFAEAD